MWFFNGEERSIGFHLANLGYDVWAGSNRGTKDCKSHTNKDITKQEFYQFSFQEMGLFDIPAFYEKVLSNYTDDTTQIIYIGHSQGTSQFFAAGLDDSTKTYIKSHTKSFIALMPIVYMTEITDKSLKILAKYADLPERIVDFFGIDEIGNLGCFYPTDTAVIDINKFCSRFKNACDSLIEYALYDSTLNDVDENVGHFLSYGPSGCSAQALEHYAQLINTAKPAFQKFDYGSEEANMKHYNQKTAPEWNVADWDIPTTLIGGGKDDLGSKGNISNMVKILNPKIFTYTNIETYYHDTVVWPRDATITFNLIDKHLKDNK